jgi:hypothetical protein
MLKHEIRLLENFHPDNHLNWQIINDGVMGGLSEGGIRINANQTADFFGHVSLQNNGGFTSVRALLTEAISGNFQKLIVRTKGDGKLYSFRLRTDKNFDGVVFASTFQTISGEWTEHEFYPEDFVPKFRGRTLTNVPPLKDLQICQIGFLIAEKQSGSFILKIDRITGIGY